MLQTNRQSSFQVSKHRFAALYKHHMRLGILGRHKRAEQRPRCILQTGSSEKHLRITGYPRDNNGLPPWLASVRKSTRILIVWCRNRQPPPSTQAPSAHLAIATAVGMFSNHSHTLVDICLDRQWFRNPSPDSGPINHTDNAQGCHSTQGFQFHGSWAPFHSQDAGSWKGNDSLAET
jgi:hypothetical protein